MCERDVAPKSHSHETKDTGRRFAKGPRNGVRGVVSLAMTRVVGHTSHDISERRLRPQTYTRTWNVNAVRSSRGEGFVQQVQGWGAQQVVQAGHKVQACHHCARAATGGGLPAAFSSSESASKASRHGPRVCCCAVLAESNYQATWYTHVLAPLFRELLVVVWVDN